MDCRGIRCGGPRPSLPAARSSARRGWRSTGPSRLPVAVWPWARSNATRATCLYIDLENGHRRIQSRIKMLFPDDRQLPDLSRLEWVNDAPALNKGFLEALDDWHGSVANPRLVVVDVLQRVKPPGNANQNAYESDYDALSGLAAMGNRAPRRGRLPASYSQGRCRRSAGSAERLQRAFCLRRHDAGARPRPERHHALCPRPRRRGEGKRAKVLSRQLDSYR